jgi:hypothetical protein
MSEVTQKLQRMLAQAQGFASQAPLEALARAELAAREAQAALETATGAERERLGSLHAIALSRVEQYGALLADWSAGVRQRADLFEHHEMERLEQPIPSKG